MCLKSGGPHQAYRDLNIIWGLQLDFVSSKVAGGIDYQNHLDDRLRRCLQILSDRRCYGEVESTLSIEEFDDLIQQELQLSESSVRNTYRRKLRDMGLIDCRQMGRHGSRVWLTPEGYTSCHPSTLDTLSDSTGVGVSSQRYVEGSREQEGEVGISRDKLLDVLAKIENIEV